MAKVRTSDAKTLKAKVINRLDADPRVNLVIALGSSADGTENDLSDIDLCVVMKDDTGLNEILRELGHLVTTLGPLVGFYTYNPYHFYIVYEGPVLLDLYVISSSLYYCLRGDRRRTLVDHAPKDAVVDTRTSVVRDLLLKGWARTFRLLSKIRKGDYVTLLYILGQIREEQIIPLLVQVGGYQIPHIKAVKLERFDEPVRHAFVATFGAPTRESCLRAVQALAELLRIMHQRAGSEIELGDLDKLMEDAYRRIQTFS